ncbi:MAG: hypothetical protein RMX96_34845 [Nostoc sp. ChiSLP02]|nr:hypothetical protein [Nostoc sp. DedSLP05]MDZ8102092.1 hypothetical protein [Nostoc sp. DedSLP01]MDZ8190001.1 hypothetical protein [Nostoc sp. ChiSLP02]
MSSALRAIGAVIAIADSNKANNGGITGIHQLTTKAFYTSTLLNLIYGVQFIFVFLLINLTLEIGQS